MPQEPSIESLRELGYRALATALDELKSGHLAPCGYIIMADLELKRCPFPPEFMDNGHAKDFLFRTLAGYSKRVSGIGIIIATDAFSLVHSPEQHASLRADPEYLRTLESLVATQGCEAAAKLGYGTLAECAMINVQTPLQFLLLRQNYIRSGENDNTITLSGDVGEISSNDGGQMSGRLMKVYQEPEKA